MANKTISISIPHKLTKEEAKSRILHGIADAKSSFVGKFALLQESWTGDRGDFRFSSMGQNVTGRVHVEDSAVRVELDLPWMLAMLAGKLRDAIRDRATKMLEHKSEDK